MTKDDLEKQNHFWDYGAKDLAEEIDREILEKIIRENNIKPIPESLSQKLKDTLDGIEILKRKICEFGQGNKSQEGKTETI